MEKVLQEECCKIQDFKTTVTDPQWRPKYCFGCVESRAAGVSPGSPVSSFNAVKVDINGKLTVKTGLHCCC